MDEISQSVQVSGGDVYLPQAVPVTKGNLQIKNVCVGNVRYSFAFKSQVTDGINYDQSKHQGPHAVWRDTLTGPMDDTKCHAATPDMDKSNLSGGTELLGQNMRLTQFSVTQPDATNSPSLYKIDIGVSFGDDDLLTSPTSDDPGLCKSVRGSEWCTSSVLHTSVVRRLKKTN